MLLGEQDFKMLKIKNEFELVSKRIEWLTCALIKRTVEAKRQLSRGSRDGFFFKIGDPNQEQIILYVERNRVYQPVCETITAIHLTNLTTSTTTDILNGSSSSSNCFKDIPVLYESGGSSSNETGFLLDDQIIRKYSTRIDCQAQKTKIVYLNASFDVVLTNLNQVVLTKVPYTSLVPFEMDLQRTGLNLSELEDMFEHHDAVRQGSDFVEQVNELVETKQGDSTFYIRGETEQLVAPDQQTNARSSSDVASALSSAYSACAGFFSSVFSYGKYLFFSLSGVVLLGACAYLVLKLVPKHHFTALRGRFMRRNNRFSAVPNIDII
jgi:hypothetical protein